MNYTLPEKDKNMRTNLYLDTLIGNSYIDGNVDSPVIQ